MVTFTWRRSAVGVYVLSRHITDGPCAAIICAVRFIVFVGLNFKHKIILYRIKTTEKEHALFFFLFSLTRTHHHHHLYYPFVGGRQLLSREKYTA